MIKQEQYEEYQRSFQGDPSFAMPTMGHQYPPDYPGQPQRKMRHFQPPNGQTFPPLQQIIPEKLTEGSTSTTAAATQIPN